ncbi:cryptochrome/photolyase family protein [Rhodovulum adriaticum]|uniref:Deoxyribodipyrimidine photo-lyase type I n=1 Tax=Rhodovulum adriaticum TaxID=35804 RepID=A0A4R2NP38_RHOAD|nr:deoxyribodipyrimidine photo-lyase [Rhodovulum adriaticum]MBK1634430.1 deoxyribodipyrimidine photolyase [Rhodovulum adriaticum]TCP23201.1 deoxyribodipyrimidine photo-lyase type I [Rhodovulum adriaticum]
MTDHSPILWWVRRDLRLSDNPALNAACASGRPVIPVCIHDDLVEGLGAAPKWRLGLGIEAFGQALARSGSRLILRRGDGLSVLRALVAETGAGAVIWTRAYDPDSVARDKAVKAALKGDGIDARSVPGHLLFEPWSVETGQGGFYKVYTPFWKTVCGREVPDPTPAPARISAPETWPASEGLSDWRMGAAMNRGAAVVARHVCVGEDAARGRLGGFVAEKIADYAQARDVPSADGTSRLSENLTYGEISPRSCWHAGRRAMEEGKPGAETFLKELVWREFAYHLVWHTPHIVTGNWRQEWDSFPWNTDDSAPEVVAWKRGRTGIEFVDAAMRELYVTGTMHNRGRMIVASYLTKHLMTHWRIGLDWFADTLIDWDPAANAMGWQWSAGSGPDATPYFRVFNPVTQLTKFDPKRHYVDAWIAEARRHPSETALSYFDAVPRSWDMSPKAAYPAPIVTAEEGRKRALAAYEARTF